MDADGYDDVIVGGWGYSSYAGRAQVFHGSVSGISTTASSALTGPAASYFGYAAANAGDMDDDGYDDVVVGAYIYTSSSGLVRTFNGSATGISTSYSGTVTGSATSCLGFSVANAGDVNGDGKSDIVAGGYCANSGNGYAAVFYGLTDADGDGYYSGSGVSTSIRDCNDADSTVHPTATEVVNDGVDNNCDNYEYCYDDDDNDGFLDTTGDTRQSSDLDCGDSNEGTTTDLTTDCDDNSAADYPGATETVANGDDEDCDGTEVCYDDDDDDGQLDTTADTRVSTDTDCNDAYEGQTGDRTTDCNDADSTIRQGAGEIIDDGIDQDCDLGDRCYDDDDDDGYLDTSSDTRNSTDLDCLDAYEGQSTDVTTDCDDNSATDYPGAAEIVGNNDDEDCDNGEICYDDDDNDGYLDTSADTRVSTDTDCGDTSEGTSSDPTTDCDDTSSSIRPGLSDTPADGIDSNCDSSEICYFDADDDGYIVSSPTTITSSDGDCSDTTEGTTSDPKIDCDDTDAADHPGATETTGNGDDEDCDGTEVCFSDDDGDGFLDSSGDTTASTDTDCTDANEGSTSTPTTDCDDLQAAINSLAAERTGDEVDSNCDGSENCYEDLDNDGSPSSTETVSADDDCGDPGEATADQLDAGEDCDDAESSTYPGAGEVPGDLVDQDCNNRELCYADLDIDGYSGGTTVASTDMDCSDVGEVSAIDYSFAPDCDDDNRSISPAAQEICDAANTDEDCDDLADNADSSADATTKTTYYSDADGDEYGDASAPMPACDLSAGYADNSSDCDDTRSDIQPGATELVGTGVDEDCDGSELCFTDTDGDAWPTGDTFASVDADCNDAGEGTAAAYAVGIDCDDTNASIHPGGQELCDASDADEDCDFLADDADPSVDPTTMTTWYTDDDDDDYGNDALAVQACDAPLGTAALGGDCDDANDTISPAALEGAGDGIDSDCDAYEECYSDADADGWATNSLFSSAEYDCAAAGGATAETYALGDDCQDFDPSINPGAQEICDEIDADEDCDGKSDDQDESATGQFSAWLDADADGYGVEEEAVYACDPGDLYALLSGDCDDVNPAVNPAAIEVCDDIDNDCDGDSDGGATDAGTWYPDADGDGYGYGHSVGLTDCDQPEAYVENGDDCDDENADINPDATEECNQLDDDCDGEVDPGEVCEAVKLDTAEGCGGCDAGGAGIPGGIGFVAAAIAAWRRMRTSGA